MCCPVVLRLKFLNTEDDSEFSVRISCLFFTIVKFPADKEKNVRKDKKAKKAVKAANTVAKDIAAGENKAADVGKSANSAERIEQGKSVPKSGKDANAEKSAKSAENTAPEKKKSGEKMSAKDIFEIAKLILDSLGKPLKKVLHRARIYRLRVNIKCGGEDAAKAAMNFGRMNIFVGNALGWIDSFFTLKPVEDVHIDVDFQKEETTEDISFVLKLSVFAALAFVLTLVGRAIRYYKSNPSAEKAVGKALNNKA
jgi:hypothetical protein